MRLWRGRRSGRACSSDRLAAARMLGERDFERYYGTISAVVRGYLQDRFGFRATALTASELQARMTDQGVERWQARLVSGLLDRCDAASVRAPPPRPRFRGPRPDGGV